MWDNVLGHAQQKIFLERFLRAAERTHALLFVGPAGVGKKLLAQAFAKSLLCFHHSGTDGCESCRLLNFDAQAVGHPDFLYLEPQADSQKIKIEQVRELLAQAAFAPALSNCRVCLVEAADQMTVEAANSFLKLLEEPPRGWLLLLLAQREAELLPTVLSRVVRLRFQHLPVALVRSELLRQGESEDAATVLARISEGSPGAAQELRQRGVFAWRAQALGFLQALPLDTPANYLAGLGWPGTTQRPAAQLLVQLLQLLLRDLLMLRAGQADGLYNCDLAGALQQLAPGWQAGSLHRALAVVEDTYRALGENSKVETALEAMALTIDQLRKE